jgi:hypothetical protein
MKIVNDGSQRSVRITGKLFVPRLPHRTNRPRHRSTGSIYAFRASGKLQNLWRGSYPAAIRSGWHSPFYVRFNGSHRMPTDIVQSKLCPGCFSYDVPAGGRIPSGSSGREGTVRDSIRLDRHVDSISLTHGSHVHYPTNSPTKIRQTVRNACENRGTNRAMVKVSY